MTPKFPPVRILALLLCLLMSSPVLAQLQRLENPTETLPCGLPVHGYFNYRATVYTWNLVSDCYLPTGGDPLKAFLHFTGSFASSTTHEYTINGNGYSIYGPGDIAWLYMESDAILNLNDITIRDQNPVCSGGYCDAIITVDSGATLVARNLILRNNAQGGAISVWGGTVIITVLQVLNVHNENTGWTGIINVSGYDTNSAFRGATLRVANSVFRGNTGGRFLFLAAYADTRIEISGTYNGEDNTYVNADEDRVDMVFFAELGGAEIIESWSSPPSTNKKKSKKTSTNKRVSTKDDSTAKPPVATCKSLSENSPVISVSATNGLESGVQCQQIEGAGIGIQSVLDVGVIDAVDVWGYVEQGVSVCFSAKGKIIFLDATDAPRSVNLLSPSVAQDDMTCAYIEGNGSLVLVEP